jgi:hypothetical protein
VEVRRRTRPMVLFTNTQSVERILYAISYRFNEHGCGLYLPPVQYGYGLYLEPVQYGYGLYLEPVQ